jgi:hypothetical protein
VVGLLEYAGVSTQNHQHRRCFVTRKGSYKANVDIKGYEAGHADAGVELKASGCKERKLHGDQTSRNKEYWRRTRDLEKGSFHRATYARHVQENLGARYFAN